MTLWVVVGVLVLWLTVLTVYVLSPTAFTRGAAQVEVRQAFKRIEAQGARVTLRGNGPDRAYRVRIQNNALPRVVRPHGELRNWYRLTDAKEHWPVYEFVPRGDH